MFNSAFFKFAARQKLQNCYMALFVGAIICMAPTYINALVNRMINIQLIEGQIIAQSITILVQLFISNIFMIGFIRMLIDVKPEEQSISRKCDYNLAFFGYKSNFKNVLKVTVLREVKVFLWSLIALIPVLAVCVLLIWLTTSTAFAAFRDEMLNIVNELINNPTEENIELLQDAIAPHATQISLYMLLFFALTTVASIPAIYKSYEYAMIPMILADNPDMKSKEIFRRSKDIMYKFKWRYFCLQVSFFLCYVLAFFAMAFTGSVLVYIIAVAAIMPYRNMACLEFYRQRNSAIAG